MSLAMLYGEEVTVQRQKKGGRSKRNRATFEEVVDEAGGPLRLRCQVDRRRGRTRSVEGTNFQADATMVYAAHPSLDLGIHDRVVDKRGEVYRVADVEEAKGIGFGGGGFFRAFLQKSREPVQEAQHAEGDE